MRNKPLDKMSERKRRLPWLLRILLNRDLWFTLFQAVLLAVFVCLLLLLLGSIMTGQSATTSTILGLSLFGYIGLLTCVAVRKSSNAM